MYRKNLPVQYLATVVNGRFIEVDVTHSVYHFFGKIKIFYILECIKFSRKVLRNYGGHIRLKYDLIRNRCDYFKNNK